MIVTNEQSLELDHLPRTTQEDRKPDACHRWYTSVTSPHPTEAKTETPHISHTSPGKGQHTAAKKVARFGGTVNRTRAGADLDRNTECSPATTRRHTTRPYHPF